MKTLIKFGRIVTAVDYYKGYILIGGKTVLLIGKSSDVEADKTIDAYGNW